MNQRSCILLKSSTQWFIVCGLVAVTASCGSPAPSKQADSAHGPEQTPAAHESTEASPHSNQGSESSHAATESSAHAPVVAPEMDHRGPHGGVLIHWAEQKMEFEVVIDRTDQSISVHARTEDQKRATVLSTQHLTVEIPVPFMRIQLDQVRQVGEPPDKSSLFRGTDANLATSQQLSGTLTGQIEQAKLDLKFHELPGHSGDF